MTRLSTRCTPVIRRTWLKGEGVQLKGAASNILCLWALLTLRKVMPSIFINHRREG
jgi:hypothetical protein